MQDFVTTGDVYDIPQPYVRIFSMPKIISNGIHAEKQPEQTKSGLNAKFHLRALKVSRKIKSIEVEFCSDTLWPLESIKINPNLSKATLGNIEKPGELCINGK